MPTTDQRYNALAYSSILEDISSSAVEIKLPVGGANAFNLAFGAGTEVWATLTDVLGEIEVIKITDMQGDLLTVERGQDVTIAKPWLAGSIITQRIAAANFLQFDQKTVFRTITFNPNGSMTANYPGEEVRETGLDACANRWWKNTNGTNWRLIAGERCPGEIDDGNGYPQPFFGRDIFVVGGQQPGSIQMQDTDGYQVDIDNWSTMSDLPIPQRAGLKSFTLNFDFMYVITGTYRNAPAPTVYTRLCDEFNLDVWAGKTPLPLPNGERQGGASFQLNDKGYYAGGRPPLGPFGFDTVDEYENVGDSWATKNNFPHTISGNVGVAISGFGYSWGGLDAGSYKQYNYRYDATGDSWLIRTNVLLPRAWGIAVEAGGKAYGYAGSRSGNSWTREIDEYDPVGNSWATKTDAAPPDITQNAGAGYEGLVYSFGGRASSPSQTDHTREYDPVGDSWSFKTALPTPARQSATASGADGGL